MTDVFQAPDDRVALKATKLVDEELLVDFNKVVQESLEHEKGPLGQLNAIIRCDKLPHVLARESDMRKMVGCLIHLILLHPPKKSKLFIYLNCNRLNSEVLPVDHSGWLHSYEICFHTNSCNEASWQSAHQQELAECAAICARFSGAFAAAYGHADSLFKLTLPGKLF